MVESKASDSEDFVSLLAVTVRGGGAECRVAGTLFGHTQPRIVRVDEFALEAMPEGPSLLIRNDDRPGVVGHIGTLLAEAGINISRMQLGLNPTGDEAVQLLNIDPAPTPEVADAVRNIPGVTRVYVLDLGEKVT